jgi:hypothetical protein
MTEAAALTFAGGSKSTNGGQSTAGLHGHPLQDNMARAAVAETLGTFILVLTIITTVVAAGLSKSIAGPAYGSLAVAVAGGVSLALVVASLGHISGAHLNPAVTLLPGHARVVGQRHQALPGRQDRRGHPPGPDRRTPATSHPDEESARCRWTYPGSVPGGRSGASGSLSAQARVRGWRRQGQDPHPGHGRPGRPPAEDLHPGLHHPAPEAGAKFRQFFAHESDEWHRAYATLRNSNEGMNGFIKDGGREAVDDPERRRIRGIAAQSVLLAFQLCAANIRKVNEFLTKKASGEKKVRKLWTRRKTRSLTRWAPASTVVTPEVDAAGTDPDPPLSA